MTDLFSLAVVPLVFSLSILGPGYCCVRATAWREGEKITAALVLSFLLVGQASFLVFVFGLHPVSRLVLLIACAASTATALPDLARALRRDSARRVAGWFALLVVWVVALLALVRSYSGGNWYADWIGHYQRSRFFLGGEPLDSLFAGALLPARPPLMNAFAAQVMALTDSGFPFYQLTAALLGILAFFPILQLARNFSPSPGAPRILALMLMFSPMFVQNSVYSWTKLQAAFFVLAGLAFYLSGWRGEDPGRIRFAFLCLAGGILTHYSAVPYALFVALHYLLRVLPQRARPGRELAAVVLATAVVLAPWFAWSTSAYGAGPVVTTALTSTGSPLPTAGANLRKALLNVRDSLVPHLWRDVAWDPRSRGWTWGHLRDASFLLYEGNLVLALGSAGALLLVAGRWRARRAPPHAASGSFRFWAGFALFNVLVGIGVHGARQPLGLAYCAQQPIVFVAIAWLASQFDAWPPALRWTAAAGLMVDAALGVLLHFWLQAQPPDPPPGWTGLFGLTRDDWLIGTADWNWILKRDAGLSFLGDLAQRQVGFVTLLVTALFGLAVYALARAAAGRSAVAG